MQPDSTRVEEIFSAALGRPEGRERRAYLATACCGDRELRARVEELVAAHEDAGLFLNTLEPPEPGGPDESTLASTSETPGTVIGRYKLLQEIGEGGFGRVFMAEQTEPVVRKVALKIIKLGMDTRQVIARFEAERQALAMMDHPNIARVLDAGATPEGRPFFVMELVRGEPITEYCDKHNLSIPDRLDLFVQVCHALQHAHQKGIIHRDLKPSNVLVSMQDGGPSARVIDFGIAKATASRLTEKTLFTEQRQFIGTPEYMSPEQAQGSLDIDTRTDVYSLGVLLYELLTGVTPFDSRRLRSAAYGEIQRIIREVEPPRPSTRLSQSTNTIVSVAAHRHTEPRRLGTTIRGDLDWIVMKCLEKDRTRRYETANGLAMDVHRHLAGEAVVAAPPSRAYRLRKIITRNKGPVAACALVAAALVLGLAGTLWQARVAAGQRDTALREAKRADDQARAEKQRADELKHVSDFQAAMLAQVDPTTAGVRLTEDVIRRLESALAKTDAPDFYRHQQVEAFRRLWAQVNATDAARELIDTTILRPAVEAIDKQFKDHPPVDAQLRQALADLYRTLGLFDAAMPLQVSALATRRRVLGEEHPSTLISINSMGGLLRAQGKPGDAEPFLREALQKRRRLLGEEHAETLQSINNMGALLQAQGKLAESEPYWREALEKNRRLLGEEHPDTLISINNMGGLLQARGKLAEAESYYREALEKRRRVLGEEHPSTLISINNMGLLLRAQGKLDEAEPYWREALEKRRRVLGDEHPGTLTSINNMGLLLQAQGKLAEAEPYWREALEKRRRVLGEEHPGTLTSINNMGTLLQDQGKFVEAEEYLREGLEKSRRVLGEEHPDTLISINNMGFVFRLQGKLAEAEPYYREALEKRRRVLGEEHPDTLQSIHNMGTLLQAQGRLAEAESYLRDALEQRARVLGSEHRSTLLSISNMGTLLQAQGRLDEAEPYLREALEKSRRVLGEEHPGTLTSITNICLLLTAQGKFAEAIEEVASAEPAARKAFTGGNAWRLGALLTAGGTARTGMGYDADGFALAEANLLEAHSILAKARREQHEDTRKCVQGLVDLYTAWDKAEPGKGYDAKAAQWKEKLTPAVK